MNDILQWFAITLLAFSAIKNNRIIGNILDREIKNMGLPPFDSLTKEDLEKLTKNNKK